jgi:hypothetical protein
MEFQMREEVGYVTTHFETISESSQDTTQFGVVEGCQVVLEPQLGEQSMEFILLEELNICNCLFQKQKAIILKVERMIICMR